MTATGAEQQPAPLAEINWRKCMVKHRLHRKPWRAAWGPPPGEPREGGNGNSRNSRNSRTPRGGLEMITETGAFGLSPEATERLRGWMSVGMSKLKPRDRR